MPKGETNQQLEEEIGRIEKDLASKREVLRREHEKGEIPDLPHEKESLREVVGEKLGRPSGQTAHADDGQTPIGDYPLPVTNTGDPLSYLSEELRGRVQELVNVAFNKSIEDAIKQVKAANNSALLDAFHDILVDELYNHLVERNKLKKL